MKHRTLILFLSLIIVLCLALSATGCDQTVTRPIEQMDMLQNALAVINRFYIDDMDIDHLDYVAATSIIESLDDFSYVTDSIYSQGSNSNIGLQLKTTPYNEYFVDMITPGLPCDHVFEDGFRLTRGDELYGVTNSTILDDDGNPIYYRLRGVNNSAYASYVTGGEGTTLTFTIYRNGQYVGEYAYTKVHSYMPRAYYIGDLYGADSPIGYIRLLGFSNVETEENGKTVLHSAADDFAACMADFTRDGKKKLILDLRGNGGGDVDLLTQIASYFVPIAEGEERTEILQLEYSKLDQVVHKYVEKDNYIADLPLVILCNQYTASAAEVLIGACRAYHPNTTVVGTHTYGKGVFQRTGITLEDDNAASRYTGVETQYYVVLVCGYYYIVDPAKPNGRYRIHKDPLQPDITITPDEAPQALIDDVEMIQAKAVLDK